MDMLKTAILFSVVLSYRAAKREIVTYTSKNAENITCSISTDVSFASWGEVHFGSTSPLFNYHGDADSVQNVTTVVDPVKYDNFECDVGESSFNLIIRNVEMDDHGEYTCILDDGTLPPAIVLSVEVPGSVGIWDHSERIDNLTTDEGSVHNLTCIARGARSHNNLRLVLSLVTGAESETEFANSTDDNSLQDYTQTIEYVARREDTVINCTLVGYVNDGVLDEHLVSAGVELHVRYVPDCIIGVTSDTDCRIAQLVCNCDGVPANYTCFFYDGGQLISISTECTMNSSIADGVTTEYTCRAANEVGLGDESESLEYTCRSDTTAVVTYTGPIIWSIVIVLTILVMAVIFSHCKEPFQLRRQHNTSEYYDIITPTSILNIEHETNNRLANLSSSVSSREGVEVDTLNGDHETSDDPTSLSSFVSSEEAAKVHRASTELIEGGLGDTKLPVPKQKKQPEIVNSDGQHI